MFVHFSRIFAVAMAAVLCFALLLPLALQRHNTPLAIGIVVVFILYAASNIVLWRKYMPKR